MFVNMATESGGSKQSVCHQQACLERESESDILYIMHFVNCNKNKLLLPLISLESSVYGEGLLSSVVFVCCY